MEREKSVLRGAYLGYSSDDEQVENKNYSSPEIIENSPERTLNGSLTSGTHLRSKLLFGNKGNKGDGAFKPLPPTEIPSVSSYGNGDQSIEAPPYSPITPRMINEINTGGGDVHVNLHEMTNVPLLTTATPLTAGESSIEVPDFSPLNSRINVAFPLPSPMPQMSPKTKELLSILEGCEDFDSDDSVQDPNFKIDALPDESSSDTSSNISTSILTTEVLIHSNNHQNAESGSTTQVDVDENIHIETHVTASSEEPSLEGIIAEAISANEGRPSKGRKRKFGQMTREERKQRKYKNMAYVNYKKKEVSPKIFVDFNCGCIKRCSEKISRSDREAEFKKFYELGSYQSQNMYITATVREHPVKRPYVSQNTSQTSKKRTFSREYFLKGIPVCRQMYVKVIQTTPKRIDTALKKMRSDSISDKRGMNGGRNKISKSCEDFFISIVNKLPTYISHYCRGTVGTAKFLRPDMTFAKIYQIYTEEAHSANIKTMSYPKAKQIFLTKFNLRCKPISKDTCNKCDFFKNKQNLVTDEEEKKKIIEEHDKHLKTAEDSQKQLKYDMALAKTDPFTETITYDLEKTLPLPRIPTNIVFYKRQLWLYNLGIHTGSDDQGHCNIWVEGEAGRGSQEVGSCLIKHLSERLKEGVTKLILWSDSCGGQNRNIKITLMLKAFLNDHPTLQEIYIRFLESGHSFLPNDTDFSKIECALKHQQRVYLPEDYMRTMRECKKIKPLQVHRMKAKDFFGSAKLENTVINRKKSINGVKVSWLKTKEILLKKEAMFSLFMRNTLDDAYEEVDLRKNQRGRQRFISRDLLDILWPNGKSIPAAKINDIKSLMHLIPRDAQGFYENLTGDINIEDDVDGFSGEPDFEVETEVDDNVV